MGVQSKLYISITENKREKSTGMGKTLKGMTGENINHQPSKWIRLNSVGKVPGGILTLHDSPALSFPHRFWILHILAFFSPSEGEGGEGILLDSFQ